MAPSPSIEPRRGSNRTLWLMLACCAAPVIMSYLAYYVLPTPRGDNYGELLRVSPARELHAMALDGRALALSDFKGRWVLLHTDVGSCPINCQRKLFATRQAKTLQNAESDRVTRLWLIRDGVRPNALLLSAQPGMAVAYVAPDQLAWLPASRSPDEYVYLLDPLGNLIMRFPGNPDIKGLSKDLSRLLRASRLG